MNKLPAWAAGLLLLCVILALTVLPFAALISHSGQLQIAELLSNTWIQRVIRFSVTQAFLSTLLSVGLAIPVAIALSREPSFFGRQHLLNAFSLSLVMPTVVAVFGIVAIYGRSGWLNTVLEHLGLPEFQLYGMTGILLAHVFFNLPLATRIFIVALDGIPPTQWRLASQLGINGSSRLKHLEWPAIRKQITGTFILIFALCLTSFAIVLTLGGGPRATTIEVAIYHALRFDFNISEAVALSLIQLVICVFVLWLSTLWKQDAPIAFSSLTTLDGWKPTSHWRAVNATIITLAAAFVLLPVIGLFLAALNSSAISVITNPSTVSAFFNTVLTATCSAGLSFILAVGILLISRHCLYRLGWQSTSQWVRLASSVILVLPPLVLGTGLFLLLRPYADVFSLALLLVVCINALMALPFVVKIIEAPLHQYAANHDRLIQSLGFTNWSRFRFIDWPVLRKPAGIALGIAASMSAGDLGAIALFGSERISTLPLLLYQRMGSYRMHEASVTAVLLLLTCLLMFTFSQWLMGGRIQHRRTAK